MAKEILDRIEDPDDHTNDYNLIIEGLWECEQRVKDKCQSRIASLERQVAAGEARMAELRVEVSEFRGCHVADMESATTTKYTELQEQWWKGYIEACDNILDHLDREPTADVVRVSIHDGSVSGCQKGRPCGDGACETMYGGHIDDIDATGDALYLVRLKGVE